MTFRWLTLASVLVVGGMAAIATVALQRLPPGTQLPIHWNAGGEADRFADADRALFLPAVLAGAASLIFSLRPRIEPLQDRLDQSASLVRTSWIGMLALMALIEVIVAAPAFGLWLPATLPLAAVGVLLIAVGNMLPKSRPGFFVGIRTPWTLTDSDNWIATHRLGARTMILGGAIILGGAVLPVGADVRSALTLAALVIAVLPPIAYSWWYWHRRSLGR